MKVFWDGHDAQAWDQAHGRSVGALQQDWAYGETMMALGVACLRARVERDGQAVALAQFSARRVGLIRSWLLVTRWNVRRMCRMLWMKWMGCFLMMMKQMVRHLIAERWSGRRIAR